ncbi:hypothetical protein ACFY4I_27870 [Streptomyces scabiei]|uniref:hypothetical protein n=1 Tax=Streptomyces scabiei TaxID=1930 RepID=UPI0036C6916C
MDISRMIDQLSSLIDDYTALIRRSKYPDASDNMSEVRVILMRLEAAIERITPSGSIYRRQIDFERDRNAPAYRLPTVVGVAAALRDDFHAGWRESVVEVVRAETYSDYLEMADGLLRQGGYKDPAAVIAGTSLEVHLRALCLKSAVDVTQPDGSPKKADTMNSDLKKAGVYDLLQQKQVTAWLDLRNKAAHGDYTSYDEGQVRLLIDGVRGFILKYPA